VTAHRRTTENRILRSTRAHSRAASSIASTPSRLRCWRASSRRRARCRPRLGQDPSRDRKRRRRPARTGGARRRARGAQRARDGGRSRGAAPGDKPRTITLRRPARTRRRKCAGPYDARIRTTTRSQAFIKSMARQLIPTAAVYYMAVMIAGGEDPKFIARRMIVFASEDVGNADPTRSRWRSRLARRRVRRPAECRINLSRRRSNLALAPKATPPT